MKSLRFSLVFALTSLLLACGTETSSSSVSGGGSTSSGGSKPDGGSSSGGGGTSTPKKTGNITLNSAELTIGGNTTQYGSAFASFVKDLPSTTGTSTCKISKAESCDVTTCEITAATGTPTPAATVSAGDISITGTDSPISLKAKDGKYELFNSRNAKLWKNGETINAEAKGDAVPAFKINAKAPDTVTLTAPTVSNAAISVKIGQSLDFAWKNGSTGNVLVSLSTSTDKQSTSILCKFASNAGKGTIPAAATSSLEASPKFAGFAVTSSSVATTLVGDYEVTLNLTSPGITSAGAASGTMTVVK